MIKIIKWWSIFKKPTLFRSLILPELEYEIYTDGSFKRGRGAWAYVILQNGQIVKEGSGRAKKTSSNRMEFQAAIEALNTLSTASRVRLYTDSRIMVDTITKWAPDWKSNGWLKKNNRPIPYSDLIQQLEELNGKHQISWYWIRAHAGNLFNERCDQLCIEARGN